MHGYKGFFTPRVIASYGSFVGCIEYCVAGMSWPVTYGEVATLAQEFLEGLSPPTNGVQAPPYPEYPPYLRS